MKKKKNIAAPQKDYAGTDSTDEAVAKLAYSLWENDGRPDGADMEYWLRAERELHGTGGSSVQNDEGAK